MFTFRMFKLKECLCLRNLQAFFPEYFQDLNKDAKRKIRECRVHIGTSMRNCLIPETSTNHNLNNEPQLGRCQITILDL